MMGSSNLSHHYTSFKTAMRNDSRIVSYWQEYISKVEQDDVTDT